MTQALEATFDGEVFRPVGSVKLPPNTRVQLIVRIRPPSEEPPKSFLEVARSMHLKGPSDWSARLDDYLYGGAKMPDDE